MGSEKLELLFQFVAQGQADIDKAAASVERLVSGAKAGSAPVDQLGQSVSKAKGLLDDAGKSFESLGGKIRSGLEQPVQGATNSLDGLFGAIGRGGAAVGAMAAGIGAVSSAAYSLVKDAGEAAQATVNLASQLNLSVGATERLQAQAKIAGVSLSTLEGASRMLAAALQDPGGQGLRAAQALDKLGVSAVTTTGQLREPGPVLLDLIRKLSEVQSASERLFLAQKVLPEDAAKALIPLIGRYKELETSADALGIGLNENVTRNLQKADDAINKLDIAFGKLKKTLAEKLAPVVIPFVVQMTSALSGPGSQSNTTAAREFIDYQELFGGNGFNPLGLKGAGPESGAYNPLGLFDRKAEMSRKAKEFRDAYAKTESGIRARLADLDGQLSEAVRVLSGDIEPSVRTSKVSERDRLTTEKASLTSRLEALRRRPDTEGIRLAVERAIESFERKQVNALARFDMDLEQRIAGLRKQGASDVDLDRVRAAAGPERDSLLSTQLRDFERARSQWRVNGPLLSPYLFDQLGQSVSDSVRFGSQATSTGDLEQATKVMDDQFKTWIDKQKKLFDMSRQGRQAEIEATVRLIELSDNEYDSARRIRDIRLTTAETELDLKKANLDYSVRIAELDKNRLESYRSTAAGVYRSIRQRGGGGVRDLLIGQLDIQGEKIFANASASLFQSAGGALGRIGASIPGAGTLLKGTLFDPANAQRPVEKNTEALGRLTKSVDSLNRVFGGKAGEPRGLPLNDLIRGSVPGLGLDGKLADFGSDINGLTGQGSRADKFFAKAFGGSSGGGSNTASFMGGLGSVFGAGLFRGVGGDFSIQTGDGTATAAGTAGRIGNVIGSAALVAAGSAGFIAGVHEGGARGTLGAASSALGIAAAIPGPQQPFIAGAAALAGIVRTLIPNPKEVFGKEQDATLNARRYEGPAVIDRSGDFAGGGDSVDYDWRGRTRIVKQVINHWNVNAMDARSIMDRKDDLADAVGRALDDGHPAGTSVQKLVFGPEGA